MFEPNLLISTIFRFWKSKEDKVIRLKPQGRFRISNAEQKQYDRVKICAPFRIFSFVGRYIDCEFHNCTIDIYRNKFKDCKFRDCKFHYSNDEKFVHFEGEKIIEGEFKFSTNDDVAFMMQTLFKPNIEKLKDEKEFWKQKFKELNEAVEKDKAERNKPIPVYFRTPPKKITNRELFDFIKKKH